MNEEPGSHEPEPQVQLRRTPPVEFGACKGCHSSIQAENGQWKCTERRAYKKEKAIGRYPRFPPAQSFAWEHCQGVYYSKFDPSTLSTLSDIAALAKRVKVLEEKVKVLEEKVKRLEEAGP